MLIRNLYISGGSKFFPLIVEHYNESIKESITITSKIHLFTDSKNMIKKLTTMNQYLTVYLKCTMDSSEWDILKMLHRLINQMKEYPTLKLVTSHQDDDPTIDIETLSTGTQLNKKADKLATKVLNKLHLKPKVTLGPSLEVVIHQWGQTITGEFNVNIQLPVLEKKYYRKQFCWSNSLYRKIDEKIFTPVYRRNKNKYFKWINKLCMRKLPVGQCIHVWESNYNKQCCFYWAECES